MWEAGLFSCLVLTQVTFSERSEGEEGDYCIQAHKSESQIEEDSEPFDLGIKKIGDELRM
jgi:hypothetical protein